MARRPPPSLKGTMPALPVVGPPPAARRPDPRRFQATLDPRLPVRHPRDPGNALRLLRHDDRERPRRGAGSGGRLGQPGHGAGRGPRAGSRFAEPDRGGSRKRVRRSRRERRGRLGRVGRLRPAGGAGRPAAHARRRRADAAGRRHLDGRAAFPGTQLGAPRAHAPGLLLGRRPVSDGRDPHALAPDRQHGHAHRDRNDRRPRAVDRLDALSRNDVGRRRRDGARLLRGGRRDPDAGAPRPLPRDARAGQDVGRDPQAAGSRPEDGAAPREGE